MVACSWGGFRCLVKKIKGPLEPLIKFTENLEISENLHGDA